MSDCPVSVHPYRRSASVSASHGFRTRINQQRRVFLLLSRLAGIPKDSVVLPVVSTMGRLMLGEQRPAASLTALVPLAAARSSAHGGALSL